MGRGQGIAAPLVSRVWGPLAAESVSGLTTVSRLTNADVGVGVSSRLDLNHALPALTIDRMSAAGGSRHKPKKANAPFDPKQTFGAVAGCRWPWMPADAVGPIRYPSGQVWFSGWAGPCGGETSSRLSAARRRGR